MHDDSTVDRQAWRFDSDNFVGLDQAKPLINDFVSKLELRQWQAAAEHHDGGGLEGGADMHTLRKFVKELQFVFRGRQLAELMISIAVGGTWTQVRRHDANLCGDNCCSRCGSQVAEDSLHRFWLCDDNSPDDKAISDSAHLLPEAVAEQSAFPCFWFRGIIPAGWTSVTPPVNYEKWVVGNTSGTTEGAWMGHGSKDRPLFLFGDASGGADTSDPRLRRVGLGVLVAISFSPFIMGPHARGPLCGPSQTVPRGELRALEIAIRWTTGYIIFVTDCESVAKGWWDGSYHQPSGPQADIWREISDHLTRQGRDASTIIVLQVPSHLEGAEIIQRKIPTWLIEGNEAADCLADEAASEARVPEAERTRVVRVEKKALLVRRRLLRVALRTIRAEARAKIAARQAAEPAPGEAPPPPPPCPLPRPPPRSVVNRFATSHVLTEDGRGCTVCRMSATKATVGPWLKSDCMRLESVEGRIFRPPRGRLVHIAGGWAHPSHALKYHESLRIWFCSSCGFFGQAQLRGLGLPCVEPISDTRREYLDRISRGLFPKA